MESQHLVKYEAGEQYLSRDARNDGFDGKDPATLPPHCRLYRNGDILAYAVAWEANDETLGTLRSVPVFSRYNRQVTTRPGSVSRWRCCSISKSDLQKRYSSADR